MNGGFTKSMNLVTLGRGLVDMEKLCDMTVEALYPDKSTTKVSGRKVGYGHCVKITIHSEDGSGQDIHITCHEDQEFILRTGGTCKAKNLQGKRLISIGQNKVYCTEVIDLYGDFMLYAPIRQEHSVCEFMFINGIGVEFPSV